MCWINSDEAAADDDADVELRDYRHNTVASRRSSSSVILCGLKRVCFQRRLIVSPSYAAGVVCM